MRFFSTGKGLIAVISSCLIAGCAGDGGKNGAAGDAGEDFVVGLAAPFTGDSSQFGVQLKMGAELFAEELNEAGGINGRMLKLNMQDDAGKAEQAQTVATTLASDDSVLAVVGHYNSSCSLAGKGIYSQAGMVMFSPGSTNVEVTKETDFVFRNIFTDAFQGKSLADYSAQILGKKNAAIMFDNDDYGTGLKDSYKARAAEVGLNVITELAYNQNAPDFRSQLTTIQGMQPAPDILLIAGLYTQAANIARQARDLGMQTQIIAGDGVFSQEYITLGGAPTDGTFVSCPFLFDLGGERAQKFADAYRKKYNAEPDAWSALAYDATAIVCEGIKKNGYTREAVLEYMKGVDSPETAYAGVIGQTFFDEEGDCLRPVQMAQVKGGKFVAAEKQLSVEPAGGAVAAPETISAQTPAVTPAATSTPVATPPVTPAPTSQGSPIPAATPEASPAAETSDSQTSPVAAQ